MKQIGKRLFTEYGMVFVLLLLCAFFSITTISEQSPVGEAAADLVAAEIGDRVEDSPGVFIAAGNLPEDALFVDKLKKLLSGMDARVLAEVRGEPKDARDALLKIVALGEKIDIIAGTPTAGDWLVFKDLETDFPTLGEPRVIKPGSYRWPNFLKSDNLLNIANQIAVIAIMAIGMTMVILTGGIDLSVGSLLALSAVLATTCIRDFAGGVTAGAEGMILSSLGAILICGAVGAFSGLMITRFGIPPFIVTLAVMLVGSGLAYLLAEGQSIYQLPDSFTRLGREADLFRFPNAVLLMLVLYAVAHLLMTRMIPGRYLYAVGGNPVTARLSGIPVKRVIVFAYFMSALLAGLGGVIMASQLKSGSPTYGNMYELYVIAAVVVGGTSLSGGQGNMIGTLIGAFTIAVIQNGMNLTNVESYTQKVREGAEDEGQCRRKHNGIPPN